MSRRRRPVRAWLGESRPIDPTELLGPRGLTAAVLEEPLAGETSTADRHDNDNDDENENGRDKGGAHSSANANAGGGAAGAAAAGGEDAFLRSLLTEQRLLRIESVIAARLQSVTVVLDRLLDPHNTAAVLRSSEGLGLLRAHVVPHEDGDFGAHRRVTQDADKWIEIVQHQSGAAAAQALAAQGFAVYAGHLDARAVLLSELPCDRPVALLFGNEHEGPSPETLAACDGTFRIPMAGFTQSFNVSVAAAISLHHLAGARRAVLGSAGDLGEAEQAALCSRYLRLAAKLVRRLRRLPRKQ